MRSRPVLSRTASSSKWGARSAVLLRTSSVLAALALVTFGSALGSAASAGTVTTWSTPTELAGTGGTGGLGDNGNVTVQSLSCAPDGGCSAGGYYDDDDGNTQAFVVNETGGAWGTPIELGSIGGGDGFLGDNGNAGVTALSCTSDGNCSAGGYYNEGENEQVFTVEEVSGTWGSPVELADADGADGFLGDGGYAYINSLSCSSTGNCSAGGGYSDGHDMQAFVVNEVSGAWGAPIELGAVGGGDGNLGANGYAYVTSISCPADGNCSAGGYYLDSDGNTQVFVINEASGTWGSPTELPAAGEGDFLGDNGSAYLTSVSCSSAGNCSAGGDYNDGAYNQAFVVSEVSGVWDTPTAIGPLAGGDGDLGDNGGAEISSVSCPSDGNCSAGGYFRDGDSQAFVVSEVSGVWGTPVELTAVSGDTGNLGDNGYADLYSLSCSSAGNCSAGGQYSDGDETQAFLVNDVSGTWGTPTEVSGLSGSGGLGDDYANAEVSALSCSSDGYCGAGGVYDIDEGDEAFVSSLTTTTTLPPPPPVTTTTTTTTVPPTTTTTTPVTTTTRPSTGLPVYVYFANDKAVLSTHDKKVLNALAKSLQASGTTHVRITGYANYLGTDRINLPLSLRRANAAKNYLIDALAARGDTGVSFTIKGAGVLTKYPNIALDRVAIVTK